MPIGPELLNPIPGDTPSGRNLRYDPLYDKIKEARREDDEGIPQGEWATTVKKADWLLVIKLCTDALTNKSKDLQLAAWLTEALVRRENFGGLRQGLDLCREMLEQFWDTLYPEQEDGDLELRASPLEWIGSRLDDSLKKIPLTKSGLDWYKYRESRAVGYEQDAQSDQKREARDQAIADGKLPPEDFDKAMASTPKDFYKQRVADIEACLESAESLGQSCDSKFGNFSPSFTGLRESLESVRQAFRALLAKKLELEPDEEVAAEAAPAEESAAAAADDWGASAGAAPAAAPARAKIPAGEPASAEDALERIFAVARWLRTQDLNNPVPYVLTRALRWAELRSGGSSVDANLLEAPPTEVRQRLKRLANEGNWEELLGACEDAMALPCSRGWLDLQRYFVKACEGYGSEAAKAAVSAELKALLADYPDLPAQVMLDDTPTANPETQAWLEEMFPPPAAADRAGETVYSDPVPAESAESVGSKEPEVFELAKEMARQGNAGEAIEMLMREAAKERSGRGRFQRNVQVSQICLSAGHEAIAFPILQGLSEEIERRKLEDWESSDLLANVLGLLFRCMAKLKVDQEEKERLYQRICRLDPLQAMHLAK